MTEDIEPKTCPKCDAPFELLPLGNAVANCVCQERCFRCQRAKFYHPKPDRDPEFDDGFACPVCDLDRDPFDPKRLYDA